MNQLSDNFENFLGLTGFTYLSATDMIMICIAVGLIAIAIIKKYEPIILLPLAFGILLGNLSVIHNFNSGFSHSINLFSWLNLGITYAIFPSLLLLGIGAMTDLSAILSNPKLLFVGLAGQIGIFTAFILSLFFGFSPHQSGAISIIGAADPSVSLFLSSVLSPDLIYPIVLSAGLYMALVSFMQPPIMKLLTTGKERMIRMKPQRTASRREKIIFPVIGVLIICLAVPASMPLIGMFFLGNLLKESGVTDRLSDTLKSVFLDIVIIFTAISIGFACTGDNIFHTQTLIIFSVGLVSFVIATFSGVIIVKFLNLFLKEDKKINPLIGNAGISALPYSARVSQKVGLEYDSSNHLLMHAFGPNAAGLIGSIIAAGLMINFLQ